MTDVTTTTPSHSRTASYENLLKVKKVELLAKMERLENGLQNVNAGSTI